MNQELLQNYIFEYEREFARIHDEEIYKWRAVKQFQATWNPDAADFADMLASSLSKTKNLMAAGNYWPREMIIRIAKKQPQSVRKMFINLFDEEIDLLERIDLFQKGSEDLNASLSVDKNDFQDHRAVLVYLSLRFPEIYYFYKFEMFKVFCEKMGYEYKPKKGLKSNIVQFLELCKTVRDEIRSNNNLLKLHKNRLGENEYYDADSNILTQDFIYAVTKHLTLSKSPESAIKPSLNLKEINIEVSKKEYQLKGSYTDYASKQKRNKHWGDLGELWVLRYEKDHCSSEFVNKISHASKSEGDGLGYDILSYDQNGHEKFIEVKTTTGNLNRPFFITGAEWQRSKKEPEKYFLYRLYNFNEKNKTADLLIIKGDLSKYCINPTEFEVIPKIVM